MVESSPGTELSNWRLKDFLKKPTEAVLGIDLVTFWSLKQNLIHNLKHYEENLVLWFLLIYNIAVCLCYICCIYSFRVTFNVVEQPPKVVIIRINPKLLTCLSCRYLCQQTQIQSDDFADSLSKTEPAFKTEHWRLLSMNAEKRHGKRHGKLYYTAN